MSKVSLLGSVPSWSYVALGITLLVLRALSRKRLTAEATILVHGIAFFAISAGLFHIVPREYSAAVYISVIAIGIITALRFDPATHSRPFTDSD